MRRFAIVLLAAWAIAGNAPAAAQQDFDAARDFSQGIIGQFEGFGNQALSEPLTVSAQFAPATDDRPAVLAITALIADGKYTYSLTQPRGGPLPTKIELEPSRQYRLLGPLRPDPPPQTHVEQGSLWKGLEIQEHEGQVTWYAPIEITAGVDPAELQIAGAVNAQVCEPNGTCQPVEVSFTAEYAEDVQAPPEIAKDLQQLAIPAMAKVPQSAVGEFQPKASAVKFRGQITPATVRPGESARIELTATLPPDGRIYALADRDNRLGTKPMLIAMQSASGLIPHRATTEAPVKIDDSTPQFGRMEYHEGKVTWTLQVDVPSEAPAGEYPIHGLFGYQACEYGDGSNNCEFPQAVRFQATLHVGGETSQAAAPLRFAPAENYNRVATVAATFADFVEGRFSATAADVAQRSALDTSVLSAADPYDLERVQVEPHRGTFAYYIALAFIGGLILNLMPCVLPVIGLKVMSFVEQAGRSRSHALVLNLWYAAGIVSVFLLLGVLAVWIGLAWGGQFGSTPFNVTLAAIVFAMALSLLGVWEVPIPGFFGSGSVQAAAAQEGPVGAFLKGVVTTVLATPCTAPFMAAAVAWAVAQSVTTTLVVFASLGIGMASPYLLVGVFPELLRFMPKPGRWMETFKQVSGFVLLGTVVFILSFIEPAAVVPTVAFLMGIGLACWFIGRTPLTAEARERLRTWGYATAVIVLFIAVSFGWLYRDVMQPRFAAQTTASRTPTEGPWQPFSLERLKQVAVDGGRTVLVDFSADWCFNCKVLEQAVLHTEPVERAIADAAVVTMYADFTNYPPEIDRTLRALQANGVPVIAIFPGDRPYEPIVFRGAYTQKGLVDALAQATGRRLPPGTQAVAEASAAPLPVN